MIKRKNFLKVFCMTIFAMVFSFVFFGIQSPVAFASEKESYEAFDNAMSDMIKAYDYHNDVERMVLSADDFFVEQDEVFISSESANKLGFKCVDKFLASSKLERVSTTQVEDKLIVSSSPEISRLIVVSDERISSHGAISKAEYGEYHIFQYKNFSDAQKAYDYFSGMDFVESVEFDKIVSANDIVVESDATTYNSWGWSNSKDWLGANEYLDALLSNYNESELQELVVAVLDSGINTAHPLLRNRIVYDYGKDFTGETSSTAYEFEDNYNHGSHVSGTIAEITLSNVKILPLKVLNSKGSGTLTMIVNAILYVNNLVQSGTLNVKVMNMSLGVESKSFDMAVSANKIASVSDLSNAINAAYELGVLSVVSAGNEKRNASSAAPANISTAITISALKQSYGQLIFDSSYSNYGDVVDFAAPGTRIYSTLSQSADSSEGYMSGTSMAAPHASACFALVLSNPYYAGYGSDSIVQLFNVSAIDYGDEGKDIYYGYGVINISDIGVIKGGEVTFSETESIQTNPISVSLSFESDYTTRIYYSLDETIANIEPKISLTTKLYVSPISISKTTRLSCMAFVYDSSDNLVKKSAFSTKTYYFDNLDLNSSYTFEEYSYGLVLSKYSGELLTLNVPKTVDGKNVVQVKEIAFNSSKVQDLYLPNSVNLIDENAFNGNSTLREIHLSNGDVTIGKNAFRNASKLETLDIENITSLGDFAFAYCKKLTNLSLKKITSIGKHAFSYSGIKTLLVGKNLASLGAQTGLSIQNVYGYKATDAVNLTGNFVDLTLRNSDLTERQIMEKGQSFTFETDVYGLEPTVSVKGVPSTSVQIDETNVNDFQKHLTIQINTSSLVMSGYEVYLQLSDFYGEVKNSENVRLGIVPAGTSKFSVDTSGVHENVKIFVDGNQIENGQLFYKNLDYTLYFDVEDGYQIQEILINGTSYSGSSVSLSSVSSDLEIEVGVRQINSFEITFVADEHSRVYVGEYETSNVVVSRGQNLTFKVSFDIGFDANIITLNGEEISLSNEKTFTISNILSDYEINIESAESVYTITLSIGKGVNALSSNGRIEAQLSDDESKTYVVSVAEGETKTYIISTLDGYKIESVVVNGETINLANNTITLSDISSDYDIVVSLGKKETKIWESDSIIVKYLLVFLGLFVVFVLAKILLAIIRREKNKTETKMLKK